MKSHVIARIRKSLTEELVISVSPFRGKPRLALRVYSVDPNDPSVRAFKKGISLTPKMWEKLKVFIPGIDKALSGKDRNPQFEFNSE